jgi:hypothetical protein
MFMIHSGPVGGNSQNWVSTVVRWAETAQNGHSVEFFFSAQIRDFFAAIIVYYLKEVLLPNGGGNSPKWALGRIFFFCTNSGNFFSHHMHTVLPKGGPTAKW